MTKEEHRDVLPRLCLGAVSFFNAAPLLGRLDEDPTVALIRAAPARLAEMLARGQVVAALAPSVDYQFSERGWQALDVGVIGSAGPVWTVQVFSRRPLGQVSQLACDPDSHTSVVLAQLLWRRRYGLVLQTEPLPERLDQAEAVLLIGDKVMSQCGAWPYQLDLGQAWYEWVGLPFVYAFWMARTQADAARARPALDAALQWGLSHREELARSLGPRCGFNSEQARQYLRHCVRYDWDAAARRGLQRFYELAYEAGLLPRCRPLGALAAPVGTI